MIASQKDIENLINQAREIMELIPMQLILEFDEENLNSYNLGISNTLQIVEELLTSELY